MTPSGPAPASVERPAGRSRWRRIARIARPVVALLVLAALIWTVVDQWRPLQDEFARLSVASLLVAGAGALVSVAGQMLCWRELLADLGNRLALRPAGRVFFLGQLGKYLPGSVWPVVAQMELARDLRVPRTRTATTVLLFMLMNVVTAAAVAGVTLPFTLDGSTAVGAWRWAFLLLVLPLAVLSPAVLNRLTAFGLRLLRRPAADGGLSVGGVARAVAWTLLEWVAAGVMLAAVLHGFGDAVSLPLAVGAFALAWGAGFVVVVVPAGAGVREAVLVVLLSGQVGHSSAFAAALVTRLLMTLADGAWALLLLPSALRGRGGLRAAARDPEAEALSDTVPAPPTTLSDTPEVPSR
jgi:uncharacterized membrane protein YbhN (UPF0104 family)